MVLPLHTLPADVQELFARLLADATTAGRLAQASRACQQLLLQRLIDLSEERRLAAQAQMEARRQRKRAAVIQCFEAIDGGAFYRCKGQGAQRAFSLHAMWEAGLCPTQRLTPGAHVAHAAQASG